MKNGQWGRRIRHLIGSVTLCFVAIAAMAAEDGSARYFSIKVVDAATGRGVPLVELTTVDNERYLTDSAGFVAFREPG